MMEGKEHCAAFLGMMKEYKVAEATASTRQSEVEIHEVGFFSCCTL